MGGFIISRVIWTAILVGCVHEPLGIANHVAIFSRDIPTDIDVKVASIGSSADRSVVQPAIDRQKYVLTGRFEQCDLGFIVGSNDSPTRRGLWRQISAVFERAHRHNSCGRASPVYDFNKYQFWPMIYIRWPDATIHNMENSSLRLDKGFNIAERFVSPTFRFSKRGVNQAYAKDAHRHPNYSSDPHSARPDGHNALGLKIALLALAFANGLASFGYAFGLFGRCKAAASPIYGYMGGVSILSGVFGCLILYSGL